MLKLIHLRHFFQLRKGSFTYLNNQTHIESNILYKLPNFNFTINTNSSNNNTTLKDIYAKREDLISEHLSELKNIIARTDMDIKKEFIINTFDLTNKLKYEQFFKICPLKNMLKNSDEKKLKTLLQQVLPLLSATEKRKIIDTYIMYNKLPKFLVLELFEEVIKINNKENFTFLDLNEVFSLFKFFSNLDTVLIKSIKNEVYTMIESFIPNFNKYEVLVKDREFLKLFHHIFLLEKKSEEINKLEFDKTNPFYNLFSNVLTENFNHLNLSQLPIIFDLFDKNYYKNDKLYSKVLENMDYIVENLNGDEKIKFYSIAGSPILNSNIIFKNPNGIKFIENYLNFFKSECIIERNTEIKKYILYFRHLMLIHSLLNNEIKNEKLEKISENLLSQYIDIIYNILILKNTKFESEYTNKFFINLFKPLVYAKSVKINLHKVEELLMMVTNNVLVEKLLERSTISFFHRDFIKYLISLNIQYKNEDRSDYLSKDIVLSGHKICIELDGIKHYFRDGEEKYSTISKRNLLQNFGWKVINVNYLVWNKLNEDEKLEYVKNKIRSVI